MEINLMICWALNGMSPCNRFKYRTRCMSCDWEYMFAGSLQPTIAKDKSYMCALSYSTKSCAMRRVRLELLHKVLCHA